MPTVSVPGGRDWRVPGACCPTSSADLVSPRFSERGCPKSKIERLVPLLRVLRS